MAMEAVTFQRCGGAIRPFATRRQCKRPSMVSALHCFAVPRATLVSRNVAGLVARAADGAGDTEEPLSEESAGILRDIQEVLDV